MQLGHDCTGTRIQVSELTIQCSSCQSMLPLKAETASILSSLQSRCVVLSLTHTLQILYKYLLNK